MRNCPGLVLLIVFFVVTNSYAQDLIVTNVGDSISCKIVKQTKTSIRFSYTKYNLHIIRELGRNKIISVVPGFFLDKPTLSMVSDTRTDSLELSNKVEILTVVGDTDHQQIGDSVMSPPLARWQFGINGGYAYRLFRPFINTTPYEMSYIEKVKSGYSLGAELFYFPWKHTGFGLKYDIYKSKAERDIRTRDDISIHFIGASVAYRLGIVDHKTSLLTALWVGYQPYKNIATHIGQSYTVNAQTMGWGVSVGVDRRISKHIALGVSGSCFISSAYKLKKYYKGRTETVNLARENFEDLSRAQITFAIKLLK